MSVKLKLTLSKEDERRATSMLKTLARKAQNVSAGLKNVGTALVQVTHDRFDSMTDPHGKAWQKLAPLTKELGGKDGSKLRRSGRLKSSVTFAVSGNVLRLGPNTIYAGVQQFGATIKPKKGRFLAIPVPKKKRNALGAGGFILLKKVTVPARPYIGFGPKDEKAAREVIEDYLAVEGAAKN